MIRIQGDRFVDDQGRTLILRGVNLGGSSKVPSVPNGATWRRDSFFDHRDVSFVGRPFPLAEADEHFGRLAHWGFTFLRLITTWEAVEHGGPGVYDEAYLDYLRAVVEKAAEYDISLFIDPHQDVWSRFSGGDGAPGWTFDAVGLDIRRFHDTGAAITHQEHGDPFPRMIWPTNYGRLANLTMWTLFFGGNAFAPDTRVDGVPVQEYLQGHFIGAMERVAERLAGLPNVVGFDTLNEPSAGLIGARDLADASPFPLRLGPSPTALQAFALGDGITQAVDAYALGLTGFRRTGSTTMNATGARAWADDAECIWRAHGVWDVDASGPVVVRPDHFAEFDGHAVDFGRDCYLPFARRYADAIRRHCPEAVIFLEGPPDMHTDLSSRAIANAAYAPHWYDGLTLLRKTYTPFIGADMTTGKVVLGRKRVARSFERQIGALIARAREEMGGMPAVIGECGIPFDMDGKAAFSSGDFSRQNRALDATMRALEANLASFTLWNYTADNTNERGDQWNDEDLSIFSRDPQRGTGTLDDGGRALEAAVRPYATAVPGEPLSLSFDVRTREFAFSFRRDPHVTAPAEFYVPRMQYPTGISVDAPGGEWTLDGQVLTYVPASITDVHTVRLRPGE